MLGNYFKIALLQLPMFHMGHALQHHFPEGIRYTRIKVSFQTVKTALNNPVKSLKTE